MTVIGTSSGRMKQTPRLVSRMPLAGPARRGAALQPSAFKNTFCRACMRGV